MADRYKFKVWNKKKKEWDTDKEWLVDVNGDLCVYEFFEPLEYAPDYMEVVRCTGINDSEGNLIYEGDIVKILHTTESDDKFCISRVAWGGDHNYPAFDFIDYDAYESNAIALTVESGEYHVKVIGNIYENSELLEIE